MRKETWRSHSANKAARLKIPENEKVELSTNRQFRSSQWKSAQVENERDLIKCQKVNGFCRRHYV